jgi:deoxyribonuclease-1
MLKKIFTSISLLLLVSCQADISSSTFEQSVLVQNNINSSSKDSNNWYEKLSPNLKEYYSEANGKQGEELFKSLHKIINQAEVLDYENATSYLYTVVDNVTNGSKKGIRAAYSNIVVEGDGPSGHKYKEIGDANGDGKKGDAINCEHTWPQSFFNKEGAMRSDLHHLFPTLSTPNSKRGSYAFGLASEGKVTYSTSSGSKLISLSDHSYVFEPSNIQKGNSARALLYFYLRYYNKNIRSSEYNYKTFFINRLSMFENWTQLDSIDEQEKFRNDSVFKRQKNRNPFIDIPNLVSIIGTKTFIDIENNLN